MISPEIRYAALQIDMDKPHTLAEWRELLHEELGQLEQDCEKAE